MKNDYLGILQALPPRQSGVVFERMARASTKITLWLRTLGLTLPGSDHVPTHEEVYNYLYEIVNQAFDSHFETYRQARQAAQNESKVLMVEDISGWVEDPLMSVTVSPRTASPEDGFTADIDINVLYEG